MNMLRKVKFLAKNKRESQNNKSHIYLAIFMSTWLNIINFEKAFDAVTRQNLWTKLHKNDVHAITRT